MDRIYSSNNSRFQSFSDLEIPDDFEFDDISGGENCRIVNVVPVEELRNFRKDLNKNTAGITLPLAPSVKMSSTPSSSIRYNEASLKKSKHRISPGQNEIKEPSVSEHESLFKLDLPVLNKMNINIPQKRTIDMLSQEMQSGVEEDSFGNLLTCPVCFEEYSCSEDAPVREPLFLECHHTLCRGCAFKMFQRTGSHKCPMCRAPLQRNKCNQKNFYVELMLKNKRLKTSSELTVWCKECQTIAKRGCANHEFQEISEAVSYLWNTNNDLWTSLTGIIADLSQSCKLSHEASKNAFSDMMRATASLTSTIQGLEQMFKKLLHRKRSVCDQMDIIQNEINYVEPYIKRFNTVVTEGAASSAEGSSSALSSSVSASVAEAVPLSFHERRLKNIRSLSHENQVNVAKQIRTVINMLIDIEKFSNVAVNNREALNASIIKVDTEQIKSLMSEKLQAVLKTVEKTFRDFDPVLDVDQNVDVVTL